MFNKIRFQPISAAILFFSIIFGSTVNLHAQFVCRSFGMPTTVTGSLNNADPQQTGRIMRDSFPSTCTGKTNSLQNSTLVRHDVQTFTNPTGLKACVTVDVNFTGCGVNDIEAVAYSSYNPATPAANVIGDLGFSTFERGSFSFSVNAGASFSIVVHEITPNSGCQNYTYNVSYSTNCRQPGFDRNNDGKAELGVYTSGGFWNTLDLTNNATSSTKFGLAADIPLVGDFSGDGQTDLTVFRPSEGIWYLLSTPNSSFSALKWGINGDIPNTGDFDRDGKADLVVFRPSEGIWYVLRSSTNSFSAFRWGLVSDKPLVGDFDGDRVSDIAVYRPNQQGRGVWYIQLSNFSNSFLTIFQWGLPTDIPVPADYDGDGTTDIAVYRPSEGNWYIFLNSPINPNPILVLKWGISEDIPQPADFDGDGKADIAIYRPSSQTWYIFGSSSGVIVKQFGSAGDKPVSAALYNTP
jgi:hypothetical protein